MPHATPAPSGPAGAHRPTLHLLCGKIASGKSTLARTLAEQPATLLLVEDEWLSALFPGEIRSLEDYVRCSGRLKAALGGHVAGLLRAGLSVVLDFPANTLNQRAWLRNLAVAADAACKLHHLDLPDETCKARLRARNARGEHPFSTSDEAFEAITRHFLPPTPEEGFDLEPLPQDPA